MDEHDLHMDFFEKYLDGVLTENERLDFEARLSYDVEFKNEFENYQLVEDGIRKHFRNEMKSKFSEIDNVLDNQHTERQNSTRKLLYWTSAVAASIFIGIMLFQHFSVSENELIAKQYWPEEPGLPVKMSTKGTYDDAMNAYKLGDLEMASSLLKKIPSDTSNYFQGIIAFKLNDYSAAKGFLLQIEESSLYFNNAQFRLGLIILSEGDKATSIKIFKSQVAEKTQFANASEEILKKI
jgi:hypothetical protein